MPSRLHRSAPPPCKRPGRTEASAPLRPAAPSSAPAVCTEKSPWPGGLALAGLRALEAAALRPPPRVCPTAPRPLPLGRWGPGGVPSALHLHLEDLPRGDNQLCERGRARLGRGEEEGEEQ